MPWITPIDLLSTSRSWFTPLSVITELIPGNDLYPFPPKLTFILLIGPLDVFDVVWYFVLELFKLYSERILGFLEMLYVNVVEPTPVTIFCPSYTDFWMSIWL